MVAHADFVAAFEAAFPNQVFLVARLADETLGLDPKTEVYIPDWHMVPAADAERYPGHVCCQHPRLQLLVDALCTLKKSPTDFRVWHLGDMYDFQRTGSQTWDADVKLKASQKDHQALIDKLESPHPQGLHASCLSGNHDVEMKNYGHPRRHLERQIAYIHGDIFSFIEILPEDVKEVFVRSFTSTGDPAATDMVMATNPHWKQGWSVAHPTPPTPPTNALDYLNAGLPANERIPLTDNAYNVLTVEDPAAADRFLEMLGHRKPQVDGPKRMFFNDAKELAGALDRSGYDIRLFVVGHTHVPRILRGRRRGRPFVVMDCGGWVGACYLSTTRNQRIHKGHLGVRVGNDLRIYQLGYSPA